MSFISCIYALISQIRRCHNVVVTGAGRGRLFSQHHTCSYKSTRMFIVVSVYNTIQYNTIQYNTIQYNTIQCNAMQCNAMQCNAVQCSAVQCSAVQCSAMQFFISNIEKNVNNNVYPISCHALYYCHVACISCSDPTEEAKLCHK